MKIVEVTLRLAIRDGDDPVDWDWPDLLGVTHHEILAVDVAEVPKHHPDERKESKS